MTIRQSPLPTQLAATDYGEIENPYTCRIYYYLYIILDKRGAYRNINKTKTGISAGNLDFAIIHK